MNHRNLRFILFPVLSILLAFSLTGQAQSAGGEHQMTVFILHPLVKIYEGDTLTLPYMVEDLSASGGITLAPLTPSEVSVSASLGSASVTSSGGLDGSITYTAEKAGQETITLSVTNYFGTAVGDIQLEIKPRPNYSLDFTIISHDTNESGGGFMEMFTGQGEFANVDDAPIQGKGNSDIWFTLWVENEVFTCQMQPLVQGTSAFDVTGVTGPVSLVPMPGSIDPFIIDLAFQPVSLNASSIVCSGLGGISANFPWPASQGNPDEFKLKSLYFPGEGGVVQITAPKTWGYVWVERK